MRRLVYAPYVQAFIKADDGVFDVSPYIVRGSVNRKVNQVSSAQLTLRNPVQGGSSSLLFTEYLGPKGSDSPHPMFHPMDPIIIMMQRLQGNPVQVFTGYLDRSPYIQLYPGLCSIEASCTLKRLLYTQWDSSLPAVQNFLSQYGWEPNGSGIWNPSAEAKGQFTDGSIGALLFAVLQVIGDWDKSTIWIESLPAEIEPIVSSLYSRIQAEVQQSEQQFKSLLDQILGSSYGTGNPSSLGGSTGNVKNLPQIVATMVAIANNHNLPPVFVVATWLAEGEVTNITPNSAGARGYFQFTSATPYSFYTTQPINYPQDAGDLGIATNLFCGAASFVLAQNPSFRAQSNWETWAETVQQPGVGAYASYWSAKVQQAQSLVQQYGNGQPVTGAVNASTSPSNNTSSGSSSSNRKKGGKSPGGKTGTPSNSTSNTNSNGVINPIPGFTGFSYDFGIDASAPQGSAVLAPANCTIAQWISNFYQPASDGSGGLLLMHFNPPVPNAPTQYWYISEHVLMTSKTVGHQFNQGDTVATFGGQGGGSGIEIGWGSTPGNDPRYGATLGIVDHTSGVWGQNFKNYFSIGGGSPVKGGATGSSGTGTSGSGPNPVAAAFSTMLDLPGIFNQAEAEMLTGKRSFLADQPLFPFVQQLCTASMRNFMSMPNGNFFAFFPDYFGFFGRKYYWEIQDIEIMDGRIDLSDDPLLTHMGVSGDTTTYTGEVQFSDLIMTAGIFDIFDAIATGYVGGSGTPGSVSSGTFNASVNQTASKNSASKGKKSNQSSTSSTQPGYNDAVKNKAVAFLQRYGARPFVEELPAIRSPIYELFLAFQNFLIAWSKQFQTPFELTFMPELFPGGLVAFPNHHFQVYVEEVIHNFDYQAGFTTTANFSSPSGLGGDPRSPLTLTDGNARPAALLPSVNSSGQSTAALGHRNQG